MNLTSFAGRPRSASTRYERKPGPGIRLSRRERRNFDAFYREYLNMALGILRTRVENEDDVVELAQEAFLRVLRYRDCDVQSLRFLLFRVSLNLSTSHLRRAMRRAEVSLEGFDAACGAPGIDEVLTDAERWSSIRVALHRLPMRDRDMLLLSRVHGLRQKDIARRCGISISSVEKRIRRAQALVREQVRSSLDV